MSQSRCINTLFKLFLLVVVVITYLGVSEVHADWRTHKWRYDMPHGLAKRLQTFYLRAGYRYDFLLRVEPASWDHFGLHTTLPLWLNLADPDKPYGDPIVVPTKWDRGSVRIVFMPPHTGRYVLQGAVPGAPAGCYATLEVSTSDPDFP